MLDYVICDKSNLENYTAVEFVDVLRSAGVPLEKTSEEMAEIYADKPLLPDFLTGMQYLDAVANKAGIADENISEAVGRIAAECGLGKKLLKVPMRVYNLHERKLLQIAQALIEKKHFCIFDYLFEAFDDNNVGPVLGILATMAQNSNVIITSRDKKDNSYASDLNARMWRIDGVTDK